MYKYLVNNGFKVILKIWHMKVTMKIKIFLWFLKKGVILTKGTLLEGNGMVVNYVASVVILNPSITSSLNVTILDFYGMLYILCLV